VGSSGRGKKPKKTKSAWGALIRRLRSVPEVGMRRQLLLEQLHGMQPGDALSFFSEVLAGVASRKSACLVALEAIHEAILQGQEQGPVYELLAEVYRLAREEENEGVARLLMITKPQRGPVAPEAVHGDLEMSQLTLGERKFLARGHDRTRLDRLLLDPEPSVVRNLLRNPHLTEQDVIRLAARRPTRTEIQKEIHASRWGSRYRIRLALVCNPYTSTELSLKLVGFLLHKDLREVRNDGNLHELVREEAKRLLKKRRKGKQKDYDDDSESPSDSSSESSSSE
jgi:hypothetical protein